jgi:hypothetical protein
LSSSLSYFSLLFLLSNQKKEKKKSKEKDKGIPCMMCITNNDAKRNGSKRNYVMEKNKCLKTGKENRKRRK